VSPLIEAWSKNRPADFPNYTAGSAGPEAANELIERDGRTWRPIG
jgi:glucose-6-phosphate 1-dehydrogenase